MRQKTDFLVIGTGVAGLSYALKVAEYGKVILVAKSSIDEGSTKLAQGGIAAVMYHPDTYEKHIKDALIAGDNLSDPEVVRITITESTERVRELIAWGAEFDRTSTGKYDLGKEGGHSEYRVLHHKDNTGFEIQRALISQIAAHPNIEVLEHTFALDIITQHHLGEEVTRHRDDIECYGAYVLDVHANTIHTILAKTTMVATGGAGNVYAVTTNPTVATGDGIAMTYRAKGIIENMEFIQFHPTALYNPGEKPSFLITEALRGFGAVLKNADGEEFMHKYDKRLSLAPRDIVARAIDNELKLSGNDFVYLDCRHLDKNELITGFPTIYAKCLSIGIDITRDMIPVAPAAHYTCGGIRVDEYARSSIQRLYASGECASTGLHGANRLASNSLLEAVVFAHRGALWLQKNWDEIASQRQLDVSDWRVGQARSIEENVLISHNWDQIRRLMWNYVGIVRREKRLQLVERRLAPILTEIREHFHDYLLTPDLVELRNLAVVAELIVRSASLRKESRGLHYMVDYPERDDVHFSGNTQLCRSEKGRAEQC